MSSDDKIIFGVNLSHDTSCAAVVGGEVKVAIAEERLNRVKYCTGMTPFGKMIPYRAIRYCCEFLGISPQEVDLFVVNSCRSNALEQLRSQLIGIPEERVVDLPHPGHHLAHAFSSFYCSPFDEAAVLVVDVNGSFFERPGTHVDNMVLDKKEHFNAYQGTSDGLRLVFTDDVLPGEVSVGELYCIYSAALQLTPRPGAYGLDDPLSAGGKLMGLASYDRGRTAAPDLWTLENDHVSIRLIRVIDRLEERGFVERRDRGALDGIFGFEMNRFVTLKQRGSRSLDNAEYLSLAGEAQRLLEKAVLEVARRLYDRTGVKNLCVAGGTMLNVTACTRLLEETPFERLFVQPAANDSGNAIGAALYAYREIFAGRRRPYLDQPYDTCLGRKYSPNEVERALEHSGGGLSVTRLDSYASKVDAILPRLLDDRIVAIFEGRSEFGPRALGHRSLVASPRSATMKDKMNRLKQREWYRPVAPAVLEEALPEFFDAPFVSAPFMTMSARVRAKTAALAPAIVHVDGTARPQTVTREQSPLLYHLLVSMGEKTSVPMLVNTSFNVDGEPIVETPGDAIRAFQNTADLDSVLIGDHLVERSA